MLLWYNTHMVDMKDKKPDIKRKKPDQPKTKLTRKQKILTVVATLIGLFVILMVLGVIGMFIAFAFFARDLPSPNTIKDRSIAQSTKIFDRNGELLYNVYGDENRVLITLDKIPKACREGTIAIEDKDFYKHKGFAIDGYLRIVQTLITERKLIGGSTISQQLIKWAFLSPERTPTRKLKELILSIQVESRFTKDEILQMYLNEIPYGGTAWGIEAASQTYFGKSVTELGLSECAMLAGLPQLPSRYSPFGPNPDAYKGRTKDVLRRMKEDNYILPNEHDEAVKKIEEGLAFASNRQAIKAPHFTLYVLDLLEDKYGKEKVEQGGLRVYTSLDLKLQEKAQTIVKEEVDKLAKAKVGNGAAVVMNPKTGEILSMVGSIDYFDTEKQGNFNVAIARRQPGSATKPFTYAVSFMKGYTPATVWIDEQTTFDAGIGQEPYKPVNYDGKFRGPVQTRFALGSSLNITAVKALEVVGIKENMQLAYDMGLSTWEPTPQNIANVGLSLTLGGREVRLLDLVSAYGVFANQGIKQEPVAIIKITDSDNKVIEEFKPQNGNRIMDAAISYLISDILSDDRARLLAFGPRSLLYIPNFTVAAKTGTTDEKRDNWAVGYTPSFVVGAWVGNNDNSRMDNSIASGITGATPIWNKIMKSVLEGKKDEPFTKPDNIVSAEVDARTGFAPSQYTTGTRRENFMKGTEPKLGTDVFVKVCKGTNEAEHDGCETEEKAFNILQDPWQKMKNKPGSCLGDCPQGGIYGNYGQIGGGDAPDINIRDIPNNANVPFTFNFTADANPKGDAQIATVRIYLDDYQLVREQKNSPIGWLFQFKDSEAGTHRIKVEATDNKGNVSTKEITVNVR